MVPLSANVKLVFLMMTAVSLYVKDNPFVVAMVNFKTKYQFIKYSSCLRRLNVIYSIAV